MLEGILELEALSSDPTSGLSTGLMYYNTTTNKIRVYNGSAWGDI